MTRICIVAHNAYGAMTGDAFRHVGGVEIQTRALTEWLSRNGYAVSVITWDEGPANRCEVSEVELVPLCRKDEGIPVVRFFYPRWISLLGALRAADADLYYQSGAEYVTGQVASWCAKHDIPFVFSVASDTDCKADLPALTTIRDRMLYRRGLKLASRVIAQTREQAKQLESDFERESYFLPMPCRVPAASIDDNAALAGRIDVLMVCRISREKNIELLLDAAKQLPHLRFNIIGPAEPRDAYAASILEHVERCANVIWQGPLPADEVMECYRRTKLLCCTSLFEGFPNTFLEAWAHGVPVVSTVDPDGVITEFGLGYSVSTIEELTDAILRIVEDPEQLIRHRKTCIAYFNEHHEPNVAIGRYAQVFDELIVS